MNNAINWVIAALLFLATLVLQGVSFVDGLLATLMTRLGINPNAQMALLLGISVLLVVAVLRRIGGIFTALIIILLVLLLLHKAMPGLQVPAIPPSVAPSASPPAGTVHA